MGKIKKGKARERPQVASQVVQANRGMVWVGEGLVGEGTRSYDCITCGIVVRSTVSRSIISIIYHISHLVHLVHVFVNRLFFITSHIVSSLVQLCFVGFFCRPQSCLYSTK